MENGAGGVVSSSGATSDHAQENAWQHAAEADLKNAMMEARK